LLIDASNLFKDAEVDTLIVTENNAAIGMIDIQDLMKLDNY
jgi:signal-transduction protein with cAMP-binding, CBS, and nucleotidyltransferase domain